MRRPEVNKFIAISPQPNVYDFTFLSPCPTSGLIIHGNKDELVPIEYIKELEGIFPEVTEVDSNHSSLVYRRALRFGMSKQFLKPYGDFLGTRKWKWVDDMTLKLSNGKKCFFTHGRSADILKVSQTMGMSAVQGHYHTKFVISYWANPDDIFFGMNVGCLINQKSMAFSYAKNFRTRFIIGCGVILNGIPRLLPMVLNEKGDWIGKIV